MTLATITAAELRSKIDAGHPFILVDALAPMIYAHSHLPGAINIPPSALDADRVANCANPNCEDSVATAQRLQELGYSNVHHYPGGKDEWRAAGFPLERAGKPYLP